ncbi:MAG: phage virion morphogenesis protein [Rhodocyclaceae bacterium]|nr:phage virion morphogenesis protein [Rhodocyclaceae bacterium]
MITLTLDDREVQAALKRLQRRLSDLTPAMRAIAHELEARTLERFETQRDPAGRPWKPLSPVTLASFNPPPLM